MTEAAALRQNVLGDAGYHVSSRDYSSLSAIQSYLTGEQELFQDTNPQIIHPAVPRSRGTYPQNIRVRFPQPPPIPPPGPLIIKERRLPQQSSQTAIQPLAALSVPPGPVITGRIPALPPRPRDVIIERWVPYGAQSLDPVTFMREARSAGVVKDISPSVVSYDTGSSIPGSDSAFAPTSVFNAADANYDDVLTRGEFPAADY